MYLGLVDKAGKEISAKRGYHRVFLGYVHWILTFPADPASDLSFFNLTAIRMPVSKENWGWVKPVFYKEAYGPERLTELMDDYVAVPENAVCEFAPGKFRIDSTVIANPKRGG